MPDLFVCREIAQLVCNLGIRVGFFHFFGRISGQNFVTFCMIGVAFFAVTVFERVVLFGPFQVWMAYGLRCFFHGVSFLEWQGFAPQVASIGQRIARSIVPSALRGMRCFTNQTEMCRHSREPHPAQLRCDFNSVGNCALDAHFQRFWQAGKKFSRRLLAKQFSRLAKNGELIWISPTSSLCSFL
ncbi:hypothetical protein RLO149_c001070 [Roseobacter litoralis Och 149]|uniref:Uncharacterized protein n=1 Tax=Roseobacter litoralis (strain ATCC 49566 / DSM 6996 / JCM 21268 / NBRC 15278 / OCh 149) TaxID=391595 RepID=F7ZEQ8_ROSLO|nr:hypothetical protein RLO149_c001070 [Roseobacter litoralis Och 149]